MYDDDDDVDVGDDELNKLHGYEKIAPGCEKKQMKLEDPDKNEPLVCQHFV